jgi:LPXTG-site transpeptidase (sortase) family protein
MSQPKLIRRRLSRRSTQPPPPARPWAAVTLAGLVLVLSGCAANGALPTAAGAPGGGATSATSADQPAPVQTARVGRPADSTRIRFVPEQLVLPGDAKAAVVPAQTVGGQLQVPSDVRHLGWWDGSSEAGDPFGSTVIAGHVDSATQGIGFFARLLRTKLGAKVTLHGAGHQITYKVVSVQTVAKQALASDSAAFDQAGPHRLVLITCTGTYHRDRGGYDSNLVVIASPLGLAR